ncbi:hypothetical protein C7S14_1305 [Burkholderia cepacia]|nr:hypothetical protein C7S14_1305 [Burkholderia cepacia]
MDERMSGVDGRRACVAAWRAGRAMRGDACESARAAPRTSG